MDQLLLRAQGGAPQDGTALLFAPEAQRIIEQLRVFPVEEYGSPKFLEQHDRLVQLNLQAHHNAAAHGDEFVMEALVSHAKLGVLVHSLLVAEAWREHAYPLLRDHLARRVDSVISWSLLYHETAVANLLEVALFHVAAAEAVGEDLLLELADWAYRKLAYLNTGGHGYAAASAAGAGRGAAELLAAPPEQELAERAAEVAWGAALCGLSVARYLTEHVGSLPLGVMARLVGGNDTVMALLPLVERPPWVRTNKKGQTECFAGGRWQAVPPADRLRLRQLDAQVWLALHNLLLDPACRAKYDPDDYRRGALQRLRRHMHEALLDQLPVLKDLQRLLDAMALGAADAAPSSAATARLFGVGAGADQGMGGGGGGGARRGGGAAACGALILEQAPRVREGIVKGRDWRALARHLEATWLGDAAAQLARERAERMLKSFEFLCSLGEPARAGDSGGAGGGAGAGGGGGGGGGRADDGVVRVECWRRVRAGVHERWCEFPCTLDGARAPEAVAVKGDSGSEARGLRHRLAGLSEEGIRPLPCDGKVVVRCRGRRAEAALQLPSVALRSQHDAPAGLWLTVGVLAADGLALQLRLKRAAKPVERDPAAGVWFAYHPVGGALTLLCDAGGGGGGGEGEGAATPGDAPRQRLE